MERRGRRGEEEDARHASRVGHPGSEGEEKELINGGFELLFDLLLKREKQRSSTQPSRGASLLLAEPCLGDRAATKKELPSRAPPRPGEQVQVVPSLEMHCSSTPLLLG